MTATSTLPSSGLCPFFPAHRVQGMSVVMTQDACVSVQNAKNTVTEKGKEQGAEHPSGPEEGPNRGGRRSSCEDTSAISSHEARLMMLDDDTTSPCTQEAFLATWLSRIAITSCVWLLARRTHENVREVNTQFRTGASGGEHRAGRRDHCT